MSEEPSSGGDKMEKETETEENALQILTLKEVEEHRHNKSSWIIIHDYVYDVTKFLDEHPGGEEVLLEQAGKDGSEAFDDVGHSTDARKMMLQYRIGELCEEDKTYLKEKAQRESWSEPDSSGSSWKSWLIPMTLAIVASLAYRYYLASAYASQQGR